MWQFWRIHNGKFLEQVNTSLEKNLYKTSEGFVLTQNKGVYLQLFKNSAQLMFTQLWGTGGICVDNFRIKKYYGNS